MNSVLIIDDDLDLCKLISEYLSKHQFKVEYQTDPLIGLASIRRHKFQVVILDIMMPRYNGIEICKRVREFSSVPIFMLSAKGKTNDRILGLDIGADDYLPKPFEPEELLSRLKALIRRSKNQVKDEVLVFDKLELSTKTNEGFKLDKKKRVNLNLTSSEFAVLTLLIKTSPEPVRRDEIFALLRGFDRNSTDRLVDILISRLRKKLVSKYKCPKYIKTVRDIGYSLIIPS